jgi:hypothetical protein
MPLHLPDFRQEYLTGLTACAWICPDRDHGDIASRKIMVRSEYRAGNVDALITLQVDSGANQHIHVHVEIERKGSGREPVVHYDSLPVDELKAIIEGLLDEYAEVYWDGRFSVPRSVLPKFGMLESLLGVSTESCGAGLELQGSKFAIRGDTFTEMIWNWDEDTDCIRATISAETKGPIGEKYLVQAVDTLQDGMNCFVLETSDDPRYANERQPEDRKRAQG